MMVALTRMSGPTTSITDPTSQAPDSVAASVLILKLVVRRDKKDTYSKSQTNKQTEKTAGTPLSKDTNNDTVANKQTNQHTVVQRMGCLFFVTL